MRLTELNPVLVSHGGSGVSTADGAPIAQTLGTGLMCDCPCGAGHAMFVPFSNPIGPGPLTTQAGWRRSGETFDTLTLTPSINRPTSLGGCGWHGFITEGEVRGV